MKDRDGVEIVIERDGLGKPIEPRCPEPGCRTMVGRPKCLFEYARDCPRHPYRLAYIAAMREWYALAAKEESVNKLTPQQFRNEYARPHNTHELTSLFWEAMDAWEANMAQGVQLEQEFAIDHAQMQAHIGALEKGLAGARRFHVRFVDDCPPYLMDAWHRWQCEVDTLLTEYDRLAAIAAEEKSHG
jgi:hypothetical protein